MDFFINNQELLWFLVVFYDLTLVILLYRFFGKYGLYAAVILGIILGNLQGGKISELQIFGTSINVSMGAILYSGIYFATDLLNEKFGKNELPHLFRDKRRPLPALLPPTRMIHSWIGLYFGIPILLNLLE